MPYREIHLADYWHVQSVLLLKVKRASSGQFRAEATLQRSADCL